jgi:hypothetical protein
MDVCPCGSKNEVLQVGQSRSKPTDLNELREVRK